MEYIAEALTKPMSKQYEIKNHKSLRNQLETIKNQLKEKEYSIPKDSFALVESKFVRLTARKRRDIHTLRKIQHRKNLIGNFLSKLFKNKLFKNQGFLIKFLAGLLAKRTGKHIHKKWLSE
ncbi:hypothetical protein [Pedobacter punctiformis]|uniref:Uncharacterized protein n=1 Tax=Pedobacter punctiformis TaxID=3004097 RepID=A0ABT4L808_9SPHI|nr:hypothetical protein [Pedobacter sp. HCMS5-2]MCZ4244066.1 hypothetical protein [Pedobacter sp. HCMS5-2]